MHNHWASFIVIVFFLISTLVLPAFAEQPYEIEWIQQLGNHDERRVVMQDTYSHSVTTDSVGNVFICGYTKGLIGDTRYGSRDVFLAKYSPSGNLLWKDQLGGSDQDHGFGIEVDAWGNAYMTGRSRSELGGGEHGTDHTFLAKYDASGNQLWTEQLNASFLGEGNSIAIDDDGNVFVGGWTLPGPTDGVYDYDAHITKYDSMGNLLWHKRFGDIGFDSSYGITVDHFGNAYICGATAGSTEFNAEENYEDYYDAYIAKYDTNGNLIWTKSLGSTVEDNAYDIAIDSSANVYITGVTYGDYTGTSAGYRDGFLTKFSDNGDLLWTKQIGTGEQDFTNAVTVDHKDNVFITGYIWSGFSDGSENYTDMYLMKFNPDGNLFWNEQLKTGCGTKAYALSVDEFGNVFVTGSTGGDFGGIGSGSLDAFLIKFAVPEPTSIIPLPLGLLALSRNRKT